MVPQITTKFGMVMHYERLKPSDGQSFEFL